MYRLPSVNALGIEKSCPVCGKRFLVADARAWRYRITKNTVVQSVCSWGCVRAYEKAHASKIKEGQMKRIQEELAGTKGIPK